MLLFFGSIPNLWIPVTLHNHSKDVQTKPSFFIVFGVEKGCMCNFKNKSLMHSDVQYIALIVSNLKVKFYYLHHNLNMNS